MERERKKERERVFFSIPFTPQMSTVSRVGPGGSQEPRTLHPGLPGGWQLPKQLGNLLLLTRCIMRKLAENQNSHIQNEHLTWGAEVKRGPQCCCPQPNFNSALNELFKILSCIYMILSCNLRMQDKHFPELFVCVLF